MASQVLDPVPKEEQARTGASVEVAAVRLESEDNVLVGRKVGTLEAAAAALVVVSRSFVQGEVVG